MVEAFVEMRGSEMGVRFGLKNGGSYFSRFGAGQAVQNKWLSVGSRLINVDWGILKPWELVLTIGDGAWSGQVRNFRHA